MPRKRNAATAAAAAAAAVPNKRRRLSATFRSRANADPNYQPRQTRSRAALPGASPLVALDMDAKPRRRAPKKKKPDTSLHVGEQKQPPAESPVSVDTPASGPVSSIEHAPVPVEPSVSCQPQTGLTPSAVSVSERDRFDRESAPSPETPLVGPHAEESVPPPPTHCCSPADLPDHSDHSDSDDEALTAPSNSQGSRRTPSPRHPDDDDDEHGRSIFNENFSFEPRAGSGPRTRSLPPPDLPHLQTDTIRTCGACGRACGGTCVPELDALLSAVSPKSVVRMPSFPLPEPAAVAEEHHAPPQRASSEGVLDRKRGFSDAGNSEASAASPSPAPKRLKRGSSSEDAYSPAPQAESPEGTKRGNTSSENRLQLSCTDTEQPDQHGATDGLSTTDSEPMLVSSTPPSYDSPNVPSSPINQQTAQSTHDDGQPSPEVHDSPHDDESSVESDHDQNDDEPVPDRNVGAAAEDAGQDRGIYPAAHNRMSTALIPIFKIYHAHRSMEAERQGTVNGQSATSGGSSNGCGDERRSSSSTNAERASPVPAFARSARSSASSTSIEIDVNLDLETGSSSASSPRSIRRGQTNAIIPSEVVPEVHSETPSQRLELEDAQLEEVQSGEVRVEERGREDAHPEAENGIEPVPVMQDVRAAHSTEGQQHSEEERPGKRQVDGTPAASVESHTLSGTSSPPEQQQQNSSEENTIIPGLFTIYPPPESDPVPSPGLEADNFGDAEGDEKQQGMGEQVENELKELEGQEELEEQEEEMVQNEQDEQNQEEERRLEHELEPNQDIPDERQAEDQAPNQHPDLQHQHPTAPRKEHHQHNPEATATDTKPRSPGDYSSSSSSWPAIIWDLEAKTAALNNAAADSLLTRRSDETSLFATPLWKGEASRIATTANATDIKESGEGRKSSPRPPPPPTHSRSAYALPTWWSDSDDSESESEARNAPTGEQEGEARRVDADGDTEMPDAWWLAEAGGENAGGAGEGQRPTGRVRVQAHHLTWPTIGGKRVVSEADDVVRRCSLGAVVTGEMVSKRVGLVEQLARRVTR